jgi:uncharacterized cupin superfamily protein
MKKFFLLVLLASVFFTGLGAMFQETAAKFKSGEKALALLQKARVAIGGDNSIAAVNSLIITGKSTRVFQIEGTERREQGDSEIALQFPDKMMKTLNFAHDGGAGEKSITKQMDVIVHSGEPGTFEWKVEDAGKAAPEGGKKVVIKKEDGTVSENGKTQTFTMKKGDGGEWTTADGDKKVFDKVVRVDGSHPRHADTGLLRTALSLLLTAPQGMDVEYLYGGETSVDGTSCNIVEARFGGASIKLFLGKDSNLPVMMSYQGEKMPVMMFKMHDGEAPSAEKVKVFNHKLSAPEMAEFQVRFSDYRNVNGVLLPYKWTQTVGGQADEVFDVTGYEVNPANIADKFKAGDHKVFVRKAKETSN